MRCLAALAVLVFLVFTFSFARPAAAMSIRVSRRPLAWSVDGSKLLAVEVQDGPEGGGSLTYLVVSASAPHYLRFEVSSDFSPGGGGTPQKISSKACRAAMARLARLVTRRQFPGLALETARCARKDRLDLVRVPDKQREAFAATAFNGTGALTLGDLTLTLTLDAATLTRAGSRLGRWPLKPPPDVTVSELEAWLEPGHRMLLVASEGGLQLVLASPTGDLGKLTPILLR
ncbi:MAG: hypothetical protein IT370_16130 [Deltaproteobacteria bacterium]|nr:hypothetical protein [Deltaproteobacteria bacterium]